MTDITAVLEGVYNDSNLRKTIVPLFISNPGLGKSQTIHQFAKNKNVRIVELITSQMSPFEISGIAMPVTETGKMTYFNFDNLESLKDGDILFFDELLNGNPVILNACLTLLESRRLISGKKLPDIMIVAAANHQGMVPLTPQVKERFVWYNIKFSRTDWSSWMIDKYNVTKTICDKLVKLIESEKFETNNFFTPRSIDKAVSMILNDVPTPYCHNLEIILNELVVNATENNINYGNFTLHPSEGVSWLKLIKIINMKNNEISN